MQDGEHQSRNSESSGGHRGNAHVNKTWLECAPRATVAFRSAKVGALGIGAAHVLVAAFLHAFVGFDLKEGIQRGVD
jgi:hypothetical protein